LEETFKLEGYKPYSGQSTLIYSWRRLSN